MALDLADDIFLLHFTFESAKRALERFIIAQSDFCQLSSPAFRTNEDLSLSCVLSFRPQAMKAQPHFKRTPRIRFNPPGMSRDWRELSTSQIER